MEKKRMSSFETEMFMSDITIRSVAQLIDELSLRGWHEADIVQLNNLHGLGKIDWGEVLKVVKGQAKIVVEHHMDMRVRPVYFDHEIIWHNGGGLFDFETQKLSLHLSDVQLRGDCEYPSGLRSICDDKRVANASVANYLIKYPYLISEDWKNMENIFFPETIFKNMRGEFSLSIKWNAIYNLWEYKEVYVDSSCQGIGKDYPIVIINI